MCYLSEITLRRFARCTQPRTCTAELSPNSSWRYARVDALQRVPFLFFSSLFSLRTRGRALVCALHPYDGGFHRREHRTGGTVARGEGGMIGDGVRREAKTGKARRGQSERGLRGCRCQATKHTPTPKGRKPPGDTSSSDTVGAESYRTLER